MTFGRMPNHAHTPHGPYSDFPCAELPLFITVPTFVFRWAWIDEPKISKGLGNARDD